jgi:uncharacterized protein YecE (DUF72 family)
VTLRVGTAGWNYADWAGRVYPDPKPRGFDELTYLARFVDVLEVNSTFHRVPTARTAADWARRTSHLGDFVFTAKVHRDFTHGEEGEGGPAEARGFLAALRPLEDAGRLGALLLQFPWSFRDGPRERRRLARLCEFFAGRPLVVEVRHASFATPEAEAYLAALGCGVADVDMPPSEWNIPPLTRTFGNIGYLRLHGRNAGAWFDREAGRDQRYDYLYTPAEVDALAGRVRRIAAATPEVFVIANNHFRGQGPTTAFMLKARLLGHPVPVPPDLLREFPALAADAVPAPPPPGAQGTLFIL